VESSFKLEVPRVFGIPITDKCHLRCISCFNTDERFNISKHMNIEDFKKIVDWAVEQKIEYLDLTPTVGEALLLTNLNEFFDYLDQSPIKAYMLITSLAHKNIDVLFNRSKLLVEVSLYGGNKEQYEQYVKRDVFDLVRDNILKLSKTSTQRINVLKRFKGKTKKIIAGKIENLKINILVYVGIIVVKNINVNHKINTLDDLMMKKQLEKLMINTLFVI
jgi:MoaA/NifB/PqqE/SkfB family radical SAM enzyme